ncbi:uncharacterized protein LOC128558765 [Mercenaria mercenaria]|uniref:uncharacterized protein LOC128558765 n=1 Tax=Mercenaria mercenaria TaxID=6596 RepID=UPI00234F32E0|nr:uncharacterized protein LOC128558765 [Mercenaria mercenaria]
MFQAPDDTQTMSMRLSGVLAEIGVDERIVMKRRRAFLLIESIRTSSTLLQDNLIPGTLIYYLGSQSEGATTPGLKSDIDMLNCDNAFNVIQDWSEWKPGVRNYLMIQDETVSSGYCLLQRLRNDIPCPHIYAPDVHHFRDRSGRILLRNTIVHAITAEAVALGAPDIGVKNGPAHTITEQPEGRSSDIVSALCCKSWPLQARYWLDQQGEGHWPSYDIRRHCSSTGCLLVGVGIKGSDNEELEWRISTSLAERCLMFSLNITQIRCYVLMKMLVKTYIKPYYKDAITSYMCKTVLFHSVANTHSNFWKECNLISCLLWGLLVLYNYILNENCPHFIIPGNNLMAGHIAHQSKSHILEILKYIMINKEEALEAIKCDDLGIRLLRKYIFWYRFKGSDRISGQLLLAISHSLEWQINECLSSIRNCSYEVAIQTLLKYIFKLNSISNQGQTLVQKACTLLAPLFYTTLGSVMASLSIQQFSRISAKALDWISMGLNTNVSSGKLKQASVFHCIGDSQRTESVLRDIEGNYDLNIVEPICHCYEFNKQAPRKGFIAVSDNHNEEALQFIAAFCVRFLPCEINCVPHELRYEMFKSTKDEISFRGPLDEWMDLAVVDSLPYLYFLQYKTYSYLGSQDDKKRALSNLINFIYQEPNLGHRETALNLLGQCMEEEDRAYDALRYYSLSLKLRKRNNAAKIHICRLLSKLVNDPAQNQSFQ